MKKSLIKGLFLSLVMVALCSNAWGTATKYTFTSKSWEDSSNAWTSNSDAYAYTNPNVQVTTGATGAGATSKDSYTDISSIKITALTTSKGVGNITVKVGDGTAQTICSLSKNTTATEYELTFSPAVSGNVTFVVNCTTNSMYVQNITITYAGGGCATLTSPSVTATEGNGQVVLEWPTNGNAASYSLVWNGGAAQTVTSPFTKTGLTNGTTYTYSLTAVGNGTTYCDSDPTEGSVRPFVCEVGEDFEGSSIGTDWTVSKFVTLASTTNCTARGGSKMGSTGGNGSGSMTTKNKISGAKLFTAYLSKETTNTTSSTWTLSASENGTSWTDVGTHSATSMGKGEWVKWSVDLSTYAGKSAYFKVSYSGSTATRYIDDVCIEAEEATELHITYDANGGNMTCVDATIAFGVYPTLAAPYTICLTTPTKSDYTFNGWLGSDEKEYQAGDEITTFNGGSLTLTAQWIVNPRTVTFNAGSGTCATASLTETSGGVGVKLPTAKPSEACNGEWEFAGWSTTSVVETTTVPTIVGTAGATYKPSADITLYAVYKKTEEVGGGTATNVSFDATTKETSKNGVNLSVTNGTLTNGTDYRVYKSAYLKIESTVGTITKIVFTFTEAAYDGGGWSSSYTPNANSWTSSKANEEQARITNIVVTVMVGSSVTTYATSPSCTPCTDAGVAFAMGENVEKVVGSANFTNTVNYVNENTGTKTYSSSDISVASVNATTGEVTIVGVGTTTITLKQPRTGGVCAVVASYVLTVTSPDVDVIEVEENGIVIETNEGNPSITVQERQTGMNGEIAEDIFFSKYFEAYRNVKLLGLFNGTTNDISTQDLRIHQFSSDRDTMQVYVTLSEFSKIPAVIESGKELIIYSYQSSTSYDSEILECAEEEDGFENWVGIDYVYKYAGKDAHEAANKALLFNGRHTVTLERTTDGGNTWTTIDIIGAVNASGGYDSSSANFKIPSWGDGYGWTCDSGKSCEDGSTIGISTNRCLLIRNKTVKSGANAVASNIGDFATLCTEWTGKQIPGTTSTAVNNSCDGFEYVGTYDYNEYYTTYVDLADTKYDATGNNDGTITIAVDNLAQYSCKQLKIQVKDGEGNLVAEKPYKVPLIVTGTKTTTASLFKEMGTEACKTCDVVVLNGAKLQKSKTGTADDVKEFHNMEIYAGGALEVPSNATDLKVNTLTMRSKGDVVSSAKIDGTITAGSYYHAKRVDGARYYFFVLPYNCNVADITYYNGKPLGTRGVDWEIKYYDGAGRAAGQNAGHWEVFTGATLAAGTGYILGVDAELNAANPTSYNDNHKLEFLFPLGTTLTETTEKASVVTAYGWGDKTIGDNHKGWNLVGVPYMSKYGVITSEGFKLGISSFDQSGDGTIYEWLENPAIVNYLNASVPYVTVPNSDGKTYTQVLASAKNLEPFKSYFVQVGLETEPNGEQGETSGAEVTAITYPQSRRTAAPVLRSVMETAEVDYVPLTLSNGTSEDVATIIVDEEQTADYTIGADLEKMYGYSTIPQLYSHMGGVKMAFNALNAVAAAGNIPLGYYAPTAGTYTFSTSASGDGLEGVYLTDNVAGKVTNLLLEDYSFTTDKTTRTTIDDRFTISVVRIATGVENLKTNDVYTFAHNKVLRINGVKVGTGVKVFDAVGRVVISDVATEEILYYNLPMAGVYLVQLEGEEGREMVKIVNY